MKCWSVFLILLLSLVGSETLHAECSFQARAERVTRPTCGSLNSENEFRILPDVLQSAQYNKYGLAHLQNENHCFWFSRKGKSIQTPCGEEGADPFSAKLSRYISTEGKYGYINWSLQPAIPAKWDYATSFQTTFAKVCEGCQTQGAATVGGKWYIINLKGRVVKKCESAHSETECSL